jgi:hypothetical protein
VKSGTVGSAFQWIAIPDLQTKTLAMSSRIVGESTPNQQDTVFNATEADNPELRRVNKNVDHRFSHSSYLRFLTFIYNAARGPGGGTPAAEPASASGVPGGQPDLLVQIQVFRHDQPVVTTPLHKIPTEGISDLQRIPYAADARLPHPAARLLPAARDHNRSPHPAPQLPNS